MSIVSPTCPTPPRQRANEPVLPSRARINRFNPLLAQQFRLWGCDIRGSKGDLVQAAGVRKVKVPGEGIQWNSRYDLTLEPTTTFCL